MKQWIRIGFGLLMWSLPVTVFAQSERDAYAASQNHLYKISQIIQDNSKSDSKKRRLVKRQVDSSLVQFDEVLERGPDSEFYADAALGKAYVLRYKRKYKQSEQLYLEAIRIFSKIPSPVYYGYRSIETNTIENLATMYLEWSGSEKRLLQKQLETNMLGMVTCGLGAMEMEYKEKQAFVKVLLEHQKEELVLSLISQFGVWVNRSYYPPRTTLNDKAIELLKNKYSTGLKGELDRAIDSISLGQNNDFGFIELGKFKIYVMISEEVKSDTIDDNALKTALKQNILKSNIYKKLLQ